MDRSAGAIARRLEEFSHACREAGLAVTPQRLAVLETLLQADDHPSPEMLYKRLKRKLPSLSLATVYKSLATLCELGFAREVPAASDRRRFDANVGAHHHFVCTSCKRISDFYDRRLDALRPSRKPPGFALEGVAVQVMGLCARCAG